MKLEKLNHKNINYSNIKLNQNFSKENSHFSNKIIFILLLFFLNSCKIPPKETTTADYISHELIQEFSRENSRKITKIPYSINALLIPKIHNKELEDDDQINLFNRKFNLTADNVDAREFFLELVNNTPVNMIVHPDLKGTISLSLKNVTIDEILEQVQKIYGFGFELSARSIRVFPVELQTKVFKINYLDLIRSGSSGTTINFSSISGSNNNSTNIGTTSNNSGNSSGSNQSSGSNVSTSHSTNVWEQLKATIEAMLMIDSSKSANPNTNNPNNPNNPKLLSKNVAISPTTGMIIVTAYPNELERIEQFLNNAELALNKQVMLETKVLEIELNDGYRSGINWALLNQHMNVSQIGNNVSGTDETISQDTEVNSNSVNPSSKLRLDTAIQDQLAPLSSQELSSFGGLFTLGMNYHKLAAFVELLSAQGNVQVLSSPRITTSNNQKALIKVGKDQFYITGITNNQTSTTNANATTNTSSPTVTLTPFFSGIALDVTPQIGEDDITLHIHPIISDVNGDPTKLPGYSEDFSLASSSVRESDSIIRAKNGQLIIIGGLMKDKTTEIITGVPFFKDIPFVGNLFRHTRQQSAKSELVILLRPIILDDYKIKRQLQKNYQKIKELDRGFHFGGGNTWYGNLGEFIE